MNRPMKLTGYVVLYQAEHSKSGQSEVLWNEAYPTLEAATKAANKDLRARGAFQVNAVNFYLPEIEILQPPA